MSPARITIVQPPLLVSRDFIDYPYHSDLGVVQAAAVLIDAGFEVQVVDAFALPDSDLYPVAPPPTTAPETALSSQVLLGAPVRSVLAAIEPADLVVVHFTPFHRPPSPDATLTALLDGLQATPVVLADLYQSGEHYVEADGERVLASYPQVAGWLKYQAEDVLAPWCASVIASAPRPTTARATAGPALRSLDALPLPAWERVDLAARDRFFSRIIGQLGRGGWAFPIDGRTLPLITSRGCPYRCAHCSSNPSRQAGEPKRQVRLSPEALRARVAQLARLGVTRVNVLDEMVNVDRAHFEYLLETFAAHQLHYDFPNGMRADGLDRTLLERMAGRITTLSVSAESGSQRVVREVVDKKLDLTRIEAAVSDAHELAIPTLIHFIIGMPGETRAEINQTLDYALDLHARFGAWPALQFATPLPGTRLADNAARANGGPLPEVPDYSPLFQHHPVTRDADFTPEQLREFAHTFQQRLHAGRGPQKVIMNVTYRCNNRCNFCAVGNRQQLDGDFDFQREVLARYRKLGLRMVDFDGGEPTLYDKLVPLIRYCRRIGYEQINVTSNGRMCVYPRFAERLVRSGLTTLLFSVHGRDAETHARNVGVPEAFDQTLDGIRQCVRFKPDGVDLGMNITLTKSNTHQLADVAQLCWDLGLRWLNIQFLTPFGRATSRVNPDTRAAADATMAVIDTWRDRMKLQVINLPFCFLPGYEDFVLGDLMKLQRHMVFVNNADVNLYEYLQERRQYAPECHRCTRKAFCGGFYDLDESPEPPWTFDILDPDEALKLSEADSTFRT